MDNISTYMIITEAQVMGLVKQVVITDGSRDGGGALELVIATARNSATHAREQYLV